MGRLSSPSARLECISLRHCYSIADHSRTERHRQPLQALQAPQHNRALNFNSDVGFLFLFLRLGALMRSQSHACVCALLACSALTSDGQCLPLRLCAAAIILCLLACLWSVYFAPSHHSLSLSLCVCVCVCVCVSGVIHLALDCRQLLYLDLSSCESLNDSALHALFLHCDRTSPPHLDLEGCRRITDQGTSFLPRHLYSALLPVFSPSLSF